MDTGCIPPNCQLFSVHVNYFGFFSSVFLCLAARVFFIGSADRDFVRLFIQYLQIFGFYKIPLLGELRRISFSTFKLRNVSIFAT